MKLDIAFTKETIEAIQEYAGRMVYGYERIYLVYKMCLKDSFGDKWQETVKAMPCCDAKTNLLRMEKLIKVYAKKSTNYQYSTFNNSIRAARNSVLTGLPIKDTVSASTDDVVQACQSDDPLKELEKLKAEKAEQRHEDKRLENSGFYYRDAVDGENMESYFAGLLAALRWKYDRQFALVPEGQETAA